MQDNLADYYIGIVSFGIDYPAISAGRLSKLEYFSIVHIASAYVRTKDSKLYRHKTKMIHFFVIAYNRKVGKPIKTPG